MSASGPSGPLVFILNFSYLNTIDHLNLKIVIFIGISFKI